MEAEAPGALAEGREEPTATQNAGLHHLPHSVVALLLDMLTGTAAGGPRPMLSTTALAGGARAAVAVAFSSKAMLQAVAAAEPLWAAQCERLGWR